MTRTGFYNELDALKEDYPDADWGFLENTTISDEMKLNAYDFLHGSCLNFAMVLHELYGYDIECIFSEEDSSLVHAYCKKQIDEVIYFIDVRGITSDYVEFIDEFSDWICFLGIPEYPISGTKEHKYNSFRTEFENASRIFIKNFVLENNEFYKL